MFPPPPKESIDWEKLGFDVYEVDGHVESHYSNETGEWSEPQFVKDPLLRLHGLTPALNYGQQAFEGLKAYRTPSGEVHIFRPQKNAHRMMRTVSYISVPPVPEARFLSCVKLAVAKNAAYVPPHGAGAALYIRPIIFGSSATLAMASPDKYTFCVYVTPVGMAYGVKAIKALILEDYDRVAPEGSGRAKIGGNYSPLVKHIKEAGVSEYGILLHLDSKTRTEIDEFSMSGFVGIKKNADETYTLVIPTPTRTIESVTSDSICEIAKDIGWKAETRTVRYDELPSFTEVLAVGTAGALVPIKSITRRSTGDVFTYNNESDERGPCCDKLLSILKDIQQGNIEDSFGWCTKVVEVSD
ncbi:aminotransferase [Nemania sp. FL0031]|nr:aminotransferase [Nemania sp. FL0031]